MPRLQVRWSGRPLPTASRCAKMVLKRLGRPSEGGGIHMEEVAIIGIDLAKRSLYKHDSTWPTATNSVLNPRLPTSGRPHTILCYPTARIYPKMCVEPPETASEPFTEAPDERCVTWSLRALRPSGRLLPQCRTAEHLGRNGLLGTRGREVGFRHLPKRRPGRTRESRHPGPVFPPSRYGPAGSSTMARNADRAVLYDFRRYPAGIRSSGDL